MNPVHFPLTPVALAALLFTAGTAFAQSAATDADSMPTVVVRASADASAQGLPAAYAGGQVARGGRVGLLGNVDIMDTPFNATNYTQALIQDQQAKSVADVVQNDPSVRVARGFGNYQELYVIRGFAVGSDDLAYNGLYGLLPRQFVASELLERVEVLRGANSFINGAAPGGGGVGGSINLLPKRAANTPLTQITVGVESGGQAYVAADVSRRFGEGDRLGVRVNAVRRDGDTAVDREERKLGVFSIGMDYRGDNFRLSGDVGYQDHKLTNPRPSVTLGATVPMIGPPSSTSNFAQPWTVSNERDTFGTVRGEVDLAKNVVAWAAFGARSGDEFNALGSPTVSNAAGDASIYRFDNVRSDLVHTGEIGVRGTLNTGAIKHTLSATASGFSQHSKNAYAISNFAGVATNIYRPVDYPSPDTSFFPNGDMDDPLVTAKSNLSSYAIADSLSMVDDTVLLTVGVRRQRIRSSSYDYNTGAALEGSYDQSANTPLAGLVFKPMQGVSLYANYIEGLQQGAIASGTGTDANGAPAPLDNVGQAFAPYKSRQKEIGVKYDGGRIGMSAALFTTKQPSAYIVNRHFDVYGEQRNRGLELSVFGTPMRGMRLLGGLTILDAEQVTTAGAINQGKDAIGVPKTQLNIGGEWDVPAVSGLSLNARALYTSTQFADGANTQEVPSWTRVDLGVNYAMRFMDRAVTLRARVDNVADKSYWASAGGYPGSGYLVQAAPRTFVVSGTVDF